MSECVVRMEMPENCLKCPLRNQCEIFCDWFGRFGTSATRKPYPKPFDKGCRIVCQLPEGHGRLVDKDLLMRDLDFLNTFGTPDDGKELSYEDILVTIDDFPTIVPAEAESPSPKPTDPVPIRDVYYVMTECDAKTGTVKYELRERSEKDGR